MSNLHSKGVAANNGDLRGVLPTGTRLRNYELLSVLGQGSFGITYRARDTTLGRHVAIKEYLPTSLALRESGLAVLPRSTELAQQFTWGRDRFLEEARTLARLDSAAAVVRVHDFLEENGTAYMIMAVAQGETLEHLIKRDGCLSPLAVDRMLHPLMDSLEQVHGAGFLHRDIKPANIILDSKGHPTLIDFGASRAAMAGHTVEMTAIFTPGYAAAEQFTSAKQGPWTDIYALSATLYHAITGAAPPSAFDRLVNDDCEPLESIRPRGFAIGLLSGIDAGLAVRGADRPQSIAEWRSSLSLPAPGKAQPVRTHDNLSNTTTAIWPRLSKSVTTQSRAVSPVLTTSGELPLAKRMRWQLLVGAMSILVLLAGSAYFIFASGNFTSVNSAIQTLTAEQLTRALEERRRADAAADEKKSIEEDARRRAEADAQAKQVADSALVKARQARQEAEEELAKLKADTAARRKAEDEQRAQVDAATQRALEEAAKRNKVEAEISALRQAQEEAQQKLAADLVAKQLAEEAAQRKAEAEMIALRDVEEAALKKAAAETAASQKANEALSKAQMERQLADEEADRQKAAFEAKKKAEDEEKLKANAEAKARASVAPPVASLPPAPAPTPALGGGATTPTLSTAPQSNADGLWSGTYECGQGLQVNDKNTVSLPISITINNGSGISKSSDREKFEISIKVTGGTVTFSRTHTYFANSLATSTLTGSLIGNKISVRGRELRSMRECSLSLTRG